MISKLRPKSYQRYITLPILGSIIDELTEWFYKRGYTNGTIRNKVNDSLRIERFFRRRGARHLYDLTHASFETARRYYRHRQDDVASTVRQIEQFLDESRELTPLPPQPITPIKSKLNYFVDYLRDVCGFATTTIRLYIKYLQNFLKYIGYDTNTKVLTKLSSKDIEGFIQICSKSLNRYSLQHVVGYLRSFLKFQYDQGILPRALHTEIDTPRVYRLEKLPRSLPWETVKALLHSIDRTSPDGIRDYAILFLIATYGLRSCEIVSLALDDIDWRAAILRVPQRKTKNKLILPLTDAVGKVLIDYLKKSRPNNLPHRELFLRVPAPNGPLKSTAVAEIFQHRVHHSGLDILYQGPHCLRHSYAVNLLRQGASLKTIGDLLGHRSAESTCVYLRLNIEDLRSAVLPVPQNPIITTKLDPILSSKYCPYKKLRKVTNKVRSPFKSFVAVEIKNYLQLKRSLGRDYRQDATAIYSLDTFLVNRYPLAKNLTAKMFNWWSLTLSHLSLTTRRRYMLSVRKFCLYQSRSHPHSFIPDPLTFPTSSPPGAPYIFSESDIVRILNATQYLRLWGQCPIRHQMIRIAIILLYTTGLRREELLRLKLCDYNSAEKTLFIKDSKFHKSRIIPLSLSVATELDTFLRLRLKNHFTMDITSPLIWSSGLRTKKKEYKGKYTGSGFRNIWIALCSAAGIFTKEGKLPRIQDVRHSFAINVLQRWYQTGENVQVKLPLLSTVMGHVSIESTCYYLSFVEGIRSEASARFQKSFGNLITINPNKNGGVQW